MSTSKKLKQKIKSQADRLNLKSLKNFDKFIDKIYFTSKHCVLYVLTNDNKWQKAQTEGPCFLIKRNEKNSISFQIILMNRNNPTNFTQDLTNRNLIIEKKDSFIFIKRISNDFVFGLWYYNENECLAYYNKLYQIVNIYLKQSIKFKSNIPNTSAYMNFNLFKQKIYHLLNIVHYQEKKDDSNSMIRILYQNYLLYQLENDEEVSIKQYLLR